MGYVCGDDNAGYYVSYATNDCSGDNTTISIASSSSSDEYTIKCTESTDCSYLTYTGYINDDTSCGELLDNGTEIGTYYSESYVFECSEGTGASYKYSCNDDGNRVWKRYTSDDCSGTASTSQTLETCLMTTSGQCESDNTGTSDDVVQRTVTAVFLMVVVM